jgi:hypothetical protein
VSSGDGMDTGPVLIVPRSEGEAATRINENEEAARTQSPQGLRARPKKGVRVAYLTLPECFKNSMCSTSRRSGGVR